MRTVAISGTGTRPPCVRSSFSQDIPVVKRFYMDTSTSGMIALDLLFHLGLLWDIT